MTFFDTAEVYGPFTNEELVGEALAPIRDQVVIATKFGFTFDSGKQAGLDSRPEHIREVAEASLKRLKTDRDRPLLPAPRRSRRADRGRRRRGQRPDSAKARSSTSGFPKRACRRSVAPTRSSLSRRFRASTRCGGGSPKQEILPTLEELGIGFVPFSPLGKGFLTGKIDENTTFDSTDFRNTVPRFTRGESQGESGIRRC